MPLPKPLPRGARDAVYDLLLVQRRAGDKSAWMNGRDRKASHKCPLSKREVGEPDPAARWRVHLFDRLAARRNGVELDRPAIDGRQSGGLPRLRHQSISTCGRQRRMIWMISDLYASG